MKQTPTCPICQDPLFGRSDKRFCSLKCKNRHHQIARTYLRNMVKLENQQRQRNLTILEGLMDARNDAFHSHLTLLTKMGFHIEFCNLNFIAKGVRLFSCYHFILTIQSNGRLLVKRNMSPVHLNPAFYNRFKIDRLLVYTSG